MSMPVRAVNAVDQCKGWSNQAIYIWGGMGQQHGCVCHHLGDEHGLHDHTSAVVGFTPKGCDNTFFARTISRPNCGVEPSELKGMCPTCHSYILELSDPGLMARKRRQAEQDKLAELARQQRASLGGHLCCDGRRQRVGNLART